MVSKFVLLPDFIEQKSILHTCDLLFADFFKWENTF